MNDADTVALKKAKGKRKYEKKYRDTGEALARKARTRKSDIAPKRITDGIPADHHSTRIHQLADRLETVRRRNPMAWADFILKQIEKPSEEQDQSKKED